MSTKENQARGILFDVAGPHVYVCLDKPDADGRDMVEIAERVDSNDYAHVRADGWKAMAAILDAAPAALAAMKACLADYEHRVHVGHSDMTAQLWPYINQLRAAIAEMEG